MYVCMYVCIGLSCYVLTYFDETERLHLSISRTGTPFRCVPVHFEHWLPHRDLSSQTGAESNSHCFVDESLKSLRLNLGLLLDRNPVTSALYIRGRWTSVPRATVRRLH